MNKAKQIEITCRNCSETFTAEYNLNLQPISQSKDILGNTVYTDVFNNKILIYPNGEKSISFKCKYCKASNAKNINNL